MGLEKRTAAHLGKRIQRERERRGWTQEEMARRLTETRYGTFYASTVAKIEAAGRERKPGDPPARPRDVKAHELVAIADVFETSTDSLLGRQYGVEDDVAYALRDMRSTAQRIGEQVIVLMTDLDAARDELDRYTFAGRAKLFDACDAISRSLAEAMMAGLLVGMHASEHAAVPPGTAVAVDETTEQRWAAGYAEELARIDEVAARAAEDGFGDDPRIAASIANLREAARKDFNQ